VENLEKFVRNFINKVNMCKNLNKFFYVNDINNPNVIDIDINIDNYIDISTNNIIENLIEKYSTNNPFYLIYMDLIEDKNEFTIFNSPNINVLDKGIFIYIYLYLFNISK
jgi:hypothetical protein